VSSRELTGWVAFAAFEAEQAKEKPGTMPAMKGL